MESYKTLDEFFEKLESERRAAPWYKKAWRGFKSVFSMAWSYISSTPGYFVNRYQRSKFGIGYQDMWHFPSYTSGLLAHAMRIQAEEGWTYPGENNGFTAEKWKKHLLDMAEDFEDYRDRWNAGFGSDLNPDWYPDYLKSQRRLEKALHRFANTFTHIGD